MDSKEQFEGCLLFAIPIHMHDVCGFPESFSTRVRDVEARLEETLRSSKTKKLPSGKIRFGLTFCFFGLFTISRNHFSQTSFSNKQDEVFDSHHCCSCRFGSHS
jgi:hypothetical protein